MWDLIASVPDHCLSFYSAITDAGLSVCWSFDTISVPSRQAPMIHMVQLIRPSRLCSGQQEHQAICLHVPGPLTLPPLEEYWPLLRVGGEGGGDSQTTE